MNLSKKITIGAKITKSAFKIGLVIKLPKLGSKWTITAIEDNVATLLREDEQMERKINYANINKSWRTASDTLCDS